MKYGRQVAAVELHAFHHVQRRFEAGAFFHGDHAFLADFFHGFGNDVADVLVGVGRDGADLGNGLGVCAGDGQLALISSTGGLVALSMPRFRSIGFMPAATDFRPSFRMAWASTVAVVVPSPATSDGLGSHFLHQLGAHVLELVFQFDFLGHGHAVLGDVGAPKDLSSTTLRPFGPRVTLTASARMFTPLSIFWRAGITEFYVFSSHVLKPLSEFCSCETAGQKASYASSTAKFRFGFMMSSSSPSTLTVLNRSTGRTGPCHRPSRPADVLRRCPATAPLPAATTSPWEGFSAAEPGSTMPPAVLVSSSTRRMTTRSCRGRSFIDSLLNNM
jgi:hypothetical protein